MRLFAARGSAPRRMSLKLCLLAGCALGTGLAWPGIAGAQEAEDAGAAERITITGSRIVRTGMVTPTPVTTVDAGEMQMMAPGNIIDVFKTLPQFLGNSTPDTAGNFAGSAGSSNLN